MSLFLKIKNLSCSYNTEGTVLQINNLEIEKGKIVFLLGSSGSGKSTLLETLGLMNNTISKGEVILFQEKDMQINFASLWTEKNLDQLNSIRKNYLSFIFQNTNLMENFTAYENICLSQMIKSNVPLDKVMVGAESLMTQVGLPISQIGINKLSVNLSGGQRQRVAFVRALNNDFKILLCDEPTGNLDELNANELLNIVKKNLNEERTAILVSHDINLALKHADQIILITKNKEKGYGEVLESNVYNKDYWQSLSPENMLVFREHILKLFSSDTSNGMSTKEENPNASSASSYKNLFLQKESKVLFGKNLLNLGILVTIIAITLLAIGFANGALDYVDRKLNDTFVNWVTVPIPPLKSESANVEEMLGQLNKEEIKKDYLLKSVTAYKVSTFKFFDNKTNEADYSKGRLINMEDPLAADLFGAKNYVSGAKNFIGDRDLGIVVTEKFLKKFNYPIDASVIYFDNSDTLREKNEHFKVPIPVRAVIKEIPGRNNFIVTDFFFQSYRNSSQSVFDFKEQNKRILFYAKEKAFAKTLKLEIEKVMQQFPLHEKYAQEKDQYSEESASEYSEEEPNDSQGQSNNAIQSDTIAMLNNENSIQYAEQDISIDISIDTCEQISAGGFQIAINLDPRPANALTAENICDKILQLPVFKNNSEKIVRIFDDGIAPEVDDEIRNDYLSINFNKGGLDRIEPFAKYMNQTLNSGQEKGDNNSVEMDSGLIKEKNNFSYLSKMTLLIILLLVIFSILSINLFISNLLKTHLNKVKMNLGTYKAFGLSDITSQNIYQIIMLRFMLLALIIGGIIAFLLGIVIENYFKQTVKIDDEITYFKMIDIQTLVLIAIIVIVTWIVSIVNIKKILSKTPGDLIYNR